MENSTLVISFISIIPGFVYLYLKWDYKQNVKSYKERNVEFVSFGNVFTDMFAKQRPELKREALIRKAGKVFGFDFMWSKNIMIAEPSLIQLILNKEFTNFTDRRRFKLMDHDPIFGNMILGAEGEKWKRLRAIMTPTFSAGKLKLMKCCIDDTVKTLMKNLNDAVDKDEIQDMKPFFSSFTLDSLIRIVLGIQVDSLVDPDNPITSSAKKIFSQDLNFSGVFRFLMTILMPKIAKILKLRITDTKEMQFFYNLSMEIVNKKREEMAKKKGDSEKGSNLIELMLEAEEAQNEMSKTPFKHMSNDEIVSNVVMMYIVGFDTSATLLTLACYFLALHPEIQQQLYQEVEQILKRLAQESSSDSVNIELISLESLNRFEYLTAVINETLRLYPPAIISERTANSDITLESEDGKYRVHFKQGDVVQFPIYSIHRSAEQFPNPEQFDPTRFIGEPNFHKFSFIPFGSGPRGCLAKSLAMMEVKLALLNVIWKYKLSVCEKTTIPVEFYYQMNILIPKSVNLKMEKRF